MKITVWTLTTDNNSGVYTGVYGSEAAAYAALRETFGGDGSLDNIPDNELDDVITKPTWEDGLGGVFYLDSQEVEVDVPEPKPKTGLHAWLSNSDVLTALSSAVDDINEAAGLDATGTIDALNLMFNAAYDYLFIPGIKTLEQVVENSYHGETLDDVIGWIKR